MKICQEAIGESPIFAMVNLSLPAADPCLPLQLRTSFDWLLSLTVLQLIPPVRLPRPTHLLFKSGSPTHSSMRVGESDKLLLELPEHCKAYHPFLLHLPWGTSPQKCTLQSISPAPVLAPPLHLLEGSFLRNKAENHLCSCRSCGRPRKVPPAASERAAE